MEEMEYEFLLRRVYNCGRDYKKGADADIYRAMDRALSNIETKTLYKTEDERQYQYRKSFTVVRRNVDQAIGEGIKKITHIASPEELKLLGAMRSVLTHSFYDKSKLDEVIREADEIFQNHGLEEG